MVGKGLSMAGESKSIVLTCTIVACVLITFYACFVLHIAILYPHFYYVPILLAGIWYQKKTVYLALGLGVLYILAVHFSLTPLTESEFIRAVIFSVVAYAVGYVSEKEAKKGRELHESEKKLAQIVHGSSIPTVVIDSRHMITHWNKACENLTGLSANEMVGTKNQWAAFYPKERQVMADFIVDNQPEEEIAKHYPGKYKKSTLLEGAYEALDFFPSLGEEGKWLLFTAAPLKNSKGDIYGVIETLQDVTERKKAEEELKVRARILESMVEGVNVSDEDGIIFFTNPAFDNMFGYERSELIGKSVSVLNTYSPEESARFVSEIIEQLKTHGAWFGEFNNVKKNGTLFTTYAHVSALEVSGKQCWISVQEDITERKRAQEELQRNAKNLNEANQELNATREALMVLNQDLEQKVKERTAEVEKLLNQKDEFINQLGHDLKTPLTPLVALLPMMKKREKDPKLKKMLEEITPNVNYMRDLVIKTLQLARLTSSTTELAIEDLNLLHVTDNVLEGVRFTLEQNGIEVVNKTDEEIIVKADKLMLEELLNNLVTNAVKFTPDGCGTITLDAKEDTDFVTVSVEDTGIGMTQEELEHAFNVFYKADESRHELESSGLGLSICKRIVEKHGGKIWAESSGKGMGTTVYFTLKSG